MHAPARLSSGISRYPTRCDRTAMNKNAIRKFAVWARNELITRIKQKAEQFGIAEHHCEAPGDICINNRRLTETEIKQRCAVIAKISENGYQSVIEEIAYTWFNRFCALRYMEVNNFLPSRMRVFCNEKNEFKPQILSEAIRLGESSIEGLDPKKIAELKLSNEIDALYKYLLIAQCNALSSILPDVFQKIGDETELLLPDNLLRQGSVAEQLVTAVPEDDWIGCVQIIGWLYQYYNAEKREEIIDPLRGKSIAKEDIPAATQLFTPDWVVRYMVDNSLGRYWLDHRPQSALRKELLYLLPQNKETSPANDIYISPESITFCDPCMGSGHILVYAFDVLMAIYRECGYSERDAAACIVGHNLYGLDIDGRAAQLACFSVMMKARSYDKRFFSRGIRPHVCAIEESNGLQSGVFGNPDLTQTSQRLIDMFQNAKEFGSMIDIPPADYASYIEAAAGCGINARGEVGADAAQSSICRLRSLARQADIMSRKYAVVCTNPPYMNKYSENLKSFIAKNYKPYGGDLFSVFIYRCLETCIEGGYCAYMTPNVWMFIKTYKKLRDYIIKNKQIVSLIQMAKGAFFKDATVDICAFVLKNSAGKSPGTYIRLEAFKGDMETQRKCVLDAISDADSPCVFETNQADFLKIPQSPIAYWLDPKLISAFKNGTPLKSMANVCQGLATTDNGVFVRRWHEIPFSDIALGCTDAEAAQSTHRRWFPYNKGGKYRKWYGNMDCVVDYENDGEKIKSSVLRKYPYLKTPDFVIKNAHCYFKPSLSWSKISSGKAAFRYYPEGFVFDVSGCSLFFADENDALYAFALLNSAVAQTIFEAISPTLNYEVGHIEAIPVIRSENDPGNARRIISELVKENIRLSKEDWDASETSWDFLRHPMTRTIGEHSCGRIADAYEAWKTDCETRFLKLKSNEETINRLFISIYGVNSQISPEISDKDITVHRIFDAKDDCNAAMKSSPYLRTMRDEIASLISYAVGCMFGRYRCDIPGLCFAGGDWDRYCKQNYTNGMPSYVAKDNIIPIYDDDCGNNGLVSRFAEWVSAVFGEQCLEENLSFIAGALGKKNAAPREILRNYFLNDFYADHVKIYQKRPIYWLFDSGKDNAFKALIYMHRYAPDTIARLRAAYVCDLQTKYRETAEALEKQADASVGALKPECEKKLAKLRRQSESLRKYEEKIHRFADRMIKIDLCDGIQANYAIFQDVLAKIKPQTMQSADSAGIIMLRQQKKRGSKTLPF